MLETRKTNLVHTIEGGEVQEVETSEAEAEVGAIGVIDLDNDTGELDNINHFV